MADTSHVCVYRFSNFALDTAARLLTRDGTPLPLSPKEYATLLCLLQAGTHAVSRDQLIQCVWPDTVVGDTSLARNISALRRHLGPGAIESIPKFGYRLTLPVSLAEPQPVQSMPPAISPPAAPPPAAPSPVSLWKRPGSRLWGASAIVLLVAGLSAARLINPNATSTPVTWTDPQTHLTWAGKDNGTDVDYQQANDYCHNLTLAGHSDWRLPTIDEAQTLYDTGISIPGVWGPTRAVYWHVKGNLHLTGSETAGNLTWLTDTTPAGEEQSYDFSYGRRNFDPITFRADHRALCVR